MADQPPATDRRSFLSKAASVAIGGLVAVVAPLAALFPILDPLRRGTDRRRMVRVAALAAIPESGEPRKVAVLDTLVDAWNRTDNVPVGSVYVQRTGEETVRVLHSVCPHLGCSVGYSAESHGYYCPCHKSRFAIDGTIADPKSPSPRAMDELEAEVRNGEVWVRFQNFRKGSPEKIPGLMADRTNWLDQRTGYKSLLREALFENVPGGARWRYVWGSTLTFCFTLQVVTGLALWMSYSPGAQTAWESVFYIQHQQWGGWFLRGLHHFTAQAMTVLLVLHLMQVVIDGAYKAPREVNFWFGVALLLLTLALSLTGYLLPWDQNGYWATAVSTNIVGMTPLLGAPLQTLLVGGASYGHHTLTRFFALHAGVIPALITLLIVGHVALFRRHGLTPAEPRKGPDEGFWPEQILRDAVACLAVLAVVVFFVVREHGAPLGAPADPSEQFSAARPEWYFLFLFEFLKYFPGKAEVLGAIVLPSILLLVLVALPLLGNWRLGHRFTVGFIGVMLAGVALLSWRAVAADRGDTEYQTARQVAARDAARAVELAQGGVPTTGALAVLRDDPFTQGPRLFSRNCASCHRYDGHDGLGYPLPKDSISASDLKGFGSRAWLTGFLHADTILTTRYWGGTIHTEGDMAYWLSDHRPETEEEQRTRQYVVMALSAQAQLPAQRAVDQRDSAQIAAGVAFMRNTSSGCAECHKFQEVGTDSPELTGWGSREWMLAFINDPTHPRFFGKDNDRMPSFGTEKSLTDREIALIVDWIRGEWKRPSPTLGAR